MTFQNPNIFGIWSNLTIPSNNGPCIFPDFWTRADILMDRGREFYKWTNGMYRGQTLQVHYKVGN